MGIDRSTWLIGGLVCAAIGFSASMVLYTTVSQNSAWEWDISIGLLILGFAGVALGGVDHHGVGTLRLPRSAVSGHCRSAVRR
jgi:hypothetical protein